MKHRRTAEVVLVTRQFERASGRKVGRFGSLQMFPAGVELFKQDELADVVYFIRDGVVKIVWTDTEGGEAIVGLRWPGWFLGASAQIVGAKSPATAVTLVESAIESISCAA